MFALFFMSLPGEETAPLSAQAASARAQLHHDLRASLNQIIGYTELLLEQAQENPHLGPTFPDLERIRAAGETMLSLLDTRLSDEEPDAAFHPVGAARVASPAHSPQPTAGNAAGATILIVDDSAPDRDLLARRLESEGHRVYQAGDGETALHQMREGSFDLAVLDLMMPGMDGIAVLKQMHEDARLQHIPVIMMSGLNNIDVAARGIEAGAEDYLLKPVNPILLRVRVNAALERKRLRDTEVQLVAQLREGYTRLSEMEQKREEWTQLLVHDLRTPLTAIIGAVQTFEFAGAMSEAQDALLRIASRSANSMLSLINDLLDVAKMEAGTLKLQIVPVSPSAAIADAIEQIRRLATEKGLALLVDTDDDLPMVQVDREKLDRVIVNLLSNAVKFTPQGEVAVGAHSDKNAVRFWVRDTGDGIPTDALPLIFEKWGQVEARRAGVRNSTGLGLTFCKMIVEAHGGTIGVSSQEGQGSTFWFSLPFAG